MLKPDPNELAMLDSLMRGPAFPRFIEFLRKRSAKADTEAIERDDHMADIYKGRARAFRELVSAFEAMEKRRQP